VIVEEGKILVGRWGNGSQLYDWKKYLSCLRGVYILCGKRNVKYEGVKNRGTLDLDSLLYLCKETKKPLVLQSKSSHNSPTTSLSDY
jgi:hypothetical protein